jgi:hypothetical protein
VQLRDKTRASDKRARKVLQPPPEQSAWLQTTEWVRYLQGHDLEAAARLIALPHASEPEPDLVAILDSLDRLVEQARDSVLQGKVNAFDQQRINSFLCSGSRTSKASDRPLAYKLKEGTYKAYKKTWKQLLYFVFRIVHLERQPALHCLLTVTQSLALNNVVDAASVFVQQKGIERYERLPDPGVPILQHKLDLACLQLYITLLDHRLMGDIFDSVIIGFLAVLGINATKEGFQEATTYTCPPLCLDKDCSDARSTAGDGYSPR